MCDLCEAKEEIHDILNKYNIIDKALEDVLEYWCCKDDEEKEDSDEEESEEENKE